MGIAHKALDCKRLFVCFGMIFGFCMLFLAQNQAKAQENPVFVIEGVTVDVTAENSVAAQQKAFEQAQVKAFETLAGRMGSAGGTAVKTPDTITLSSLINDFEVTNEQVSDVRYVGTYTFRFRENETKQLFNVTGVSYTATANNPLLVLPFYQAGGKNIIWGEENLWLAAWSRANLPPAIVPVSIPIGDLPDVSDIEDSQGLNYNPQKLAQMQNRYGASESAVVVAGPDGLLAAVGDDSSTAAGALQIGIYRTDLGAPQLVKQLSVTADGKETRAQLYDRAALTAYQALQSDWKTKSATSIASAASSKGYVVKIPINGLKDWVRIQKSLGSLPGMNEVSVESVSPREAKAALNFRGDEGQLRQTLEQFGMALGDKDPSGAFVLDAQGAPQGAGGFYAPPTSSDASGSTAEPAAGTQDFYNAPAPAESDAAGDDMVQTF